MTVCIAHATYTRVQSCTPNQHGQQVQASQRTRDYVCDVT